MDHVGEVMLGYFDWKGFDLAGPNGGDPIPHRGQRETADTIEETPHCQVSHFATAAAIVLVVLMAV